MNKRKHKTIKLRPFHKISLNYADGVRTKKIYADRAIQAANSKKIRTTQTICITDTVHLNNDAAVEDGQSIATRVQVALKKTSQALQKQIAVYNSLKFKTVSDGLLSQITYNDVKDPSAQIYKDLEEKIYASIGCHLPGPGEDSKIRHQAIEVVSIIDRAKEEQYLVHLDMMNMIEHLKDEHIDLLSKKQEFSQDSDMYAAGCRSMMIKRLAFLERKINLCFSKFKACGLEFNWKQPRQFLNIFWPDNYDNDVEEDVDSMEDLLGWSSEDEVDG